MQFEQCGSNSDYAIQNGFHPLNEWHHVAVVKKAGSWSYYLDGQLKATSAMSAVPCTSDPSTPFLIGGLVTDELHLFKGAIDELRVYGRDLTAYEVQALYEESETAVVFDVKPGSCDNPVNITAKGVLPVAILGSETFDVTDIDVSTIRILELAPLRSSIEDVISVEYCDGPGDGIPDLTLKLDTVALAEAIGPVGDGEAVLLTVTGLLKDGTAFRGEDGILVVTNQKDKKNK